MAITDQQILDEIQEFLIEPVNNGASWASGLWTSAEVLSYLNNRQNQFVKETGLLLTYTSIAATPNVNRQPLPTNCLFVQDLSWENADNEFVEIPRSTTWEGDNGINSWPYNMVPIPLLYTDSEVPTLAVQLMPATSDNGVLWAIYAALSTTLTGAGVAFTVPDECVPAVKWGCVADMLLKLGRSLDRNRAAWAESRYREGVEAVRVILLGWETGG